MVGFVPAALSKLERLTLQPAGNERDMTVQMIVRLKAKLGEPGCAKDQTGNVS